MYVMYSDLSERLYGFRLEKSRMRREFHQFTSFDKTNKLQTERHDRSERELLSTLEFHWRIRDTRQVERHERVMPRRRSRHEREALYRF